MLAQLNQPVEGEEGLLPAQEAEIKKRIGEITAAEGLELEELQEKAVSCPACIRTYRSPLRMR